MIKLLLENKYFSLNFSINSEFVSLVLCSLFFLNLKIKNTSNRFTATTQIIHSN